jgi:hypothetical protein
MPERIAAPCFSKRFIVGNGSPSGSAVVGPGVEGAKSGQEPPIAGAIEIRISEIAQLFHSLDPFPFRERDLDVAAEEFIVSWARELPTDQPIRIVVHLPKRQALTSEAQELGPAITRYFNQRAQAIALDLRELFRIGRRALVIGLTVLTFSVVVSQTVAMGLELRPIAGVIQESLLIFGWVANWRPLEIFLYEWWPIVRRRNLYRRLARAEVELRPFTVESAPSEQHISS